MMSTEQTRDAHRSPLTAENEGMTRVTSADRRMSNPMKYQNTTDNKDAGSTVNKQSLVVAAIPGADDPVIIEADRVRHTPSKTIIWMSESESNMIDLIITERDVEARSLAAKAVLTGAAGTREDAHADDNRIMTDGGQVEEPGVSVRELLDEQPDKDDYVFEAFVCVTVGDRVIDATQPGNPVGTIEARERPEYRMTPAYRDLVINFDADGDGERVVHAGHPQAAPLMAGWVKCNSTGRVALIGFDVARHDAAEMDCPVCGNGGEC